MESGVYAAPTARFVNTWLTRLPFRSSSYRFPSSLLANTVPFTSTPGAFTHHSNPKGWSEVQVKTPWLLYPHELVFLFWKRHLTDRSGLVAAMKYCSGYPGLVAVRSGGQMVASLQYEPTSP